MTAQTNAPRVDLTSQEGLDGLAVMFEPLHAAVRRAASESERAFAWAESLPDPARSLAAGQVAVSLDFARSGLKCVVEGLGIAYGVFATQRITGVDASHAEQWVASSFTFAGNVVWSLDSAYCGARQARAGVKFNVPSDQEHLAVLRPSLETLGGMARDLATPTRAALCDPPSLYGKPYERLLECASRLEQLPPSPLEVTTEPGCRSPFAAIREILDGSGDEGVSVEEVGSRTGYGRNTVERMLSVLVSLKFAMEGNGRRYLRGPLSSAT